MRSGGGTSIKGRVPDGLAWSDATVAGNGRLGAEGLQTGLYPFHQRRHSQFRGYGQGLV